jgi:hypothetical protein
MISPPKIGPKEKAIKVIHTMFKCLSLRHSDENAFFSSFILYAPSVLIVLMKKDSRSSSKTDSVRGVKPAATNHSQMVSGLFIALGLYVSMIFFWLIFEDIFLLFRNSKAFELF